MSYGYMGKLLRVNLSERRISEEVLKQDWAEEYLGGVGLGARILFEELSGDADALSEENRLLFMTGPVTATPFPTSARYSVCTLSPLTGIWLDTNAAGVWAAPFKRCGYDGLILEGKAESPVYLNIDETGASLRDAAHLWGQDALEVQESIRAELGQERSSVACIGPAGEKCVLLAGIVNDEGRVAGRGGLLPRGRQRGGHWLGWVVHLSKADLDSGRARVGHGAGCAHRAEEEPSAAVIGGDEQVGRCVAVGIGGLG